MGDGSTDATSVPAKVSLSGAFTAVRAGAKHNCAVVSGAVHCWGNGAHGQIGQGKSATVSAPGTAVAFP